MLTYKDITSIGEYIPGLFQNVTKLYLSNNNISSLTGIGFFRNLSYLSIANNYIERFEEFLKLSSPEKMVSISVKGNFFCKNPNSNSQIVGFFNK